MEYCLLVYLLYLERRITVQCSILIDKIIMQCAKGGELARIHRRGGEGAWRCKCWVYLMEVVAWPFVIYPHYVVLSFVVLLRSEVMSQVAFSSTELRVFSHFKSENCRDSNKTRVEETWRALTRLLTVTVYSPIVFHCILRMGLPGWTLSTVP